MDRIRFADENKKLAAKNWEEFPSTEWTYDEVTQYMLMVTGQRCIWGTTSPYFTGTVMISEQAIIT